MKPTLHEHVDLPQRCNRETLALSFQLQLLECDYVVGGLLHGLVDNSISAFFDAA